MASIRKLADGRWQAQFRPIPGGKQITRTTRRKADAQRWLDEQQALVVTGHFVDPGAGKITFGNFFNLWASRQVWVTGTKIDMARCARSATFWDVPLQQIRRSHVEAWVQSLESRRRNDADPRTHAKGQLAAITIKTRIAKVRTVLRAAVEDKRIASDPSLGVKLPRVRRTADTITLPSTEQVRALLQAADPKFRIFLSLCAFAGLRRGEATAVKIGNFDPTRGILSISQQAQFYTTARKADIRRPKHGSERKVALADDLATMLSGYISKHDARADPEAWLFPGRNEDPIHSVDVGNRWKTAKRRAGVESLRLHDLRHFFASGLIASGCDVITVQRALGHSNATMTLGTYAHLWPSAEDRARAAASAMLAEVLRGPDEQLTNHTAA